MGKSSSPLQAVTDGRIRRSRMFVGEDAPAMTLSVLIVFCFIGQFFLPGGFLAGGLSSDALAHGRWYTLFSYMFEHGGLGHLLGNVSALVALGAPVRRRLPPKIRGWVLLYGLFFVCGIAGGLLFVAIHFNGSMPVIGASGAICGLWGAAARLNHENNDLEAVFSRAVWRQAKSFGIANTILVGVFLLPGLILFGKPLIPIAWEAHLGGFIAGLLLIGPVLRFNHDPAIASSQ